MFLFRPLNKPLEKKTVMRKHKEMLVMVNTRRRKKNKVPSEYSKTANDDSPYQRAYGREHPQQQ